MYFLMIDSIITGQKGGENYVDKLSRNVYEH